MKKNQKKETGKMCLYDDNHNLVCSLTLEEFENLIHNEIARLIETSCEINESNKKRKRKIIRSLREVAEHIISMDNVHPIHRGALEFILANEKELGLNLDHHYEFCD